MEKNNFKHVIFLVVMLNFLKILPIDKIGIWADWDLPCGIAEYSKHLFVALTKKNIKVIKFNHNTPFERIMQALQQEEIKILNIQHDPGLFPNVKKLANFLQDLKALKIKTIGTIHDERLEFINVYNALDFCIFHQRPYCFKKSNYKIIEFPVPTFNKPIIDVETLRRKYGYNKNDKILVTTGFIFSFKKIPEILTNLIPNLKSDSFLKIQLLNAITPRFYHLCYQESKRVGAIIEEHNLYNQVSFITRFLSEQELEKEYIYQT